MSRWRPMKTAPRDGYTHILVCYQRHMEFTADEEPDFYVNQAVWDLKEEQWMVWYKPVMFEPYCTHYNDGRDGDVIGWMAMPPTKSNRKRT